MIPFEATFTWETDEAEEIRVTVSGKYNPATQGNRRGHPDSWTEGDPMEIDVESVRLSETGALQDPAPFTNNGRFMEKICEVVEEIDREGYRRAIRRGE